MSTLLDVPLSSITVVEGRNPRKVDITDEQGQRTKASIAKRGILQPLVVHTNGGKGKYNLIAGERRFRIAQELKLKTVPVIVRANGDDALSVAAEENLHRRELSPLEEAIAFQRLIDAGLTPDGVAEELNVALKRVTERLPILKLTVPMQEAVGAGDVPTSHVGFLSEMVAESKKVGHMVCKAILDGFSGRTYGNEKVSPWDAAVACGRDGARYVAAAADKYAPATMVSYPHGGLQITGKLLAALPKDTRDQVKALSEVKDRYGYTREYRAEFSEALLDSLKQPGSGCVWFGSEDRGLTGITWEDHAWLVANLPPVVKADFDAIEVAEKKVAKESAKAKAKAIKALGDKATPAQIAEAEAEVARETAAKAQRRAELDADKAHVRGCREANIDLGVKLLNGLSSLKLTRDVALFLCHTSLVPGGHYYDGVDTVPRLAARGLAVVLPEWQTETTMGNGNVKVAYLSMDEAEKRFWKWWNLAKTPEEIVGRTIIAHAAAEFALQDAVPKGQQVAYSMKNGKDGAALKALQALVKKHLPASRARRLKGPDPVPGQGLSGLPGTDGLILKLFTSGRVSGAKGDPIAKQVVAEMKKAHPALDITQAGAKRAVDELFNRSLLAGAKVSPIVTDEGKAAAKTAVS